MSCLLSAIIHSKMKATEKVPLIRTIIGRFEAKRPTVMSIYLNFIVALNELLCCDSDTSGKVRTKVDGAVVVTAIK